MSRSISVAVGLGWALAGVACDRRQSPPGEPRALVPVPAPLARAQREEPRAPAAEDPPADPDDAVYVRGCRLSGLRSGKVKIESDHQISLIDGARTVATGETEHDFQARQVEASCARRSITLKLETAHEYREVTLAWKHRQLVETSSVFQRQ